MSDTRPLREQIERLPRYRMIGRYGGSYEVEIAPGTGEWVRYSDVLALLDQREAAAGWQPIETAPKDGTVIVGALIRDGKVWRVHEMKHNGLAFYTLSGGSLPRMTHWMPLPPAPSGAKE